MAIPLAQTSTKEFQQLNNFITTMTSKARQDYQSLKEFSENEFQKLNHQYHLNLYKKGEFVQFINNEKEFFCAKILEVNKKGVIKVQKEDKTIVVYNFQEIQMIIK